MPDGISSVRADLPSDRWPEVTPVQEIRAAIEKLIGLRGDEPWRLVGGNEWITPIGIGVAPDDGGISIDDAELIVTLHRTIDAQLHILQETIFQLSGAPESRGFIGNEFNLIMQLVTAINGTPQ